MKSILIVTAALALVSPAKANEAVAAAPPAPSLTAMSVRTCLEVLAGLNSLNFVGQMSPQQVQQPSALPYHLGGSIRMTMAFDIAELSKIQTVAQKAQQDFDKELDEKDPAIRQKQLDANWQGIIAAPCNVTPGRIKESDLRLGDGPNENAIPPSVLSVLVPIIDRGN